MVKFKACSNVKLTVGAVALAVISSSQICNNSLLRAKINLALSIPGP